MKERAGSSRRRHTKIQKGELDKDQYMTLDGSSVITNVVFDAEYELVQALTIVNEGFRLLGPVPLNVSFCRAARSTGQKVPPTASEALIS